MYTVAIIACVLVVGSFVVAAYRYANKCYNDTTAGVFILGVALLATSSICFYCAGAAAVRKELVLSYPVENRMELSVNSQFSIELLRLLQNRNDSNKGFELGLVKILEECIALNPLIRYYEGEIVLPEQWLKEPDREKRYEGYIGNKHTFSGTWQIRPAHKGRIEGVYHLYCEINLSDPPTVQIQEN